jgi:tripartite ATP-independent transporter DctP family solute receptor
VSTFAAASLPRFPAAAAEFTFKCGLNVPAAHPTGVAALEAARGIETESGGRVQVQVFPSSQLGDDTSMLVQLRSNAIQLYSATGGTLAALVPITAIEGVAFAFSSYDRATQALDGSLGQYIRDGIRKAGFYPFEKFGIGGYHHVTNSLRPIARPEDVQGMKIRIPPGPIEIPALKTVGAVPTTVSSAEMYAALQTHLVDGCATALASIDGLKLFEVQKYLSLTRHLFTSHFFVANPETMQNLPKNLHEIVDRNFNASELRQRNTALRGEDASMKSLPGKGMTINSPDLAPFRAAMRKARLYEQWQSLYGQQAWTLLEKVTGQLA